MNLKITGLHLDITDAIRARVTEKLQRINRHSDNILSVTVTLSVDKLEHKAAAQVHLAGKDIYAETVENDMYAAIDMLADKLDRTLLQHKEKSNSIRYNGSLLKAACTFELSMCRLLFIYPRRSGSGVDSLYYANVFSTSLKKEKI